MKINKRVQAWLNRNTWVVMRVDIGGYYAGFISGTDSTWNGSPWSPGTMWLTEREARDLVDALVQLDAPIHSIAREIRV